MCIVCTYSSLRLKQRSRSLQIKQRLWKFTDNIDLFGHNISNYSAFRWPEKQLLLVGSLSVLVHVHAIKSRAKKKALVIIRFASDSLEQGKYLNLVAIKSHQSACCKRLEAGKIVYRGCEKRHTEVNKSQMCVGLNKLLIAVTCMWVLCWKNLEHVLSHDPFWADKLAREKWSECERQLWVSSDRKRSFNRVLWVCHSI